MGWAWCGSQLCLIFASLGQGAGILTIVRISSWRSRGTISLYFCCPRLLPVLASESLPLLTTLTFDMLSNYFALGTLVGVGFGLLWAVCYETPLTVASHGRLKTTQRNKCPLTSIEVRRTIRFATEARVDVFFEVGVSSRAAEPYVRRFRF